MQTLELSPVWQRWAEDSDGVLFTGRRYTVFVQPDRTIRVIDLKTGEQTPVENFTFSQGDSFMPSPSGDKLLYTASESDSAGLNITQMGVLDLGRGSFYAFGREGGEELYEISIGWLDDSRIELRSHSEDLRSYYIRIYEFA